MVLFKDHMFMSPWLNMTQLKVLGFNEKYVYFTLFFIVLLISYILIQPIITWMITFQTTKFLSYLVSSLFVIVVFLLMLLFVDIITLTDVTVFGTFKIVLQSLAVFGICLIVYNQIGRWFKTKQ